MPEISFSRKSSALSLPSVSRLPISSLRPRGTNNLAYSAARGCDLNHAGGVRSSVKMNLLTFERIVFSFAVLTVAQRAFTLRSVPRGRQVQES
jgi:hypothetical protein